MLGFVDRTDSTMDIVAFVVDAELVQQLVADGSVLEQL
jgi:hypothetical protein